MAKCAEQKMRLPTTYELLAAYNARVLSTWDPKGWYWASNESDEDNSASLVVLSHFGRVRTEPKGYANFVRCVQK